MSYIGGITKTFKNLMSKQDTPKLNPERAIDKMVLCEDGKTRRIKEISGAVAAHKRDCFIINEGDPESEMGYFVHALEISCLVLGHRAPTQEAKDASSRLWKTMVLANAKDLHDKVKSGKKLPLEFD